MKLVDANVLVYAVDRRAAQHAKARAWFEGALRGTEVTGFAWSVLIAFLRLTTHPNVFDRPLETEEAAGLVDSWLAEPPSLVVHPTQRHLPLMRSLLSQTGVGGNLVNDAHLAALALEYDATIVSYDRDFERFEGVRREQPSA